jgi:RHS repeat-associated protein
VSSSSNVTKDYCALGENRAGTNYFYTKDHLGSIRELADDSGNIQAQYCYAPYGQPTKLQGSLDCDFQYAGYFYEATSGFNLTRSRAYDPSLGRWISRDPIGESGGNLYGYTANAPVNWRDPLGLYTQNPNGINCVGNACGMDSWIGPNTDPKKMESLEKMMSELGYTCKRVNSSRNCKGDVIVFTPHTEPGASDPGWNAPYDYNTDGWYHAVNRLTSGTGPDGNPDPSLDTWGSQMGAFPKPSPAGTYKTIPGLPEADAYVLPGANIYCCSKCSKK